MQNKKTPSAYLFSAITALWSCLSFSYLTTLVQESVDTRLVDPAYLPQTFLDGWGTIWGVLFAALFYLYKNKLFTPPRHVHRCMSTLLGVCFGLFMVIGSALRYHNSLAPIIASPMRFCYSIFISVGFAFAFIPLIELALTYLSSPCKQAGPLGQTLFERHAFAAPFLVILVCYLPYIVAFFPGTVHWDALWQLNQFEGVWKWTTHHSPFSTLIMGGCMRTGMALGSGNIGLFIYSCSQMLLSVAIIASAFVLMRDLKTPYSIRFCALLFWALYPVFPIYAITLSKDPSFAYAFLLYVLLLIRLVVSPDTFRSKRRYPVLFALSILLVCLLRSNGLAVIVLSGIVTLMCLQGKKLRLQSAACYALPLALALIFSNVIVPALGIESAGITEAMSIPLQQTARIATTCDDTPQEEIDVIDKVIDYALIKAAYLPEKSDGAKSIIRANVADGDWSAYLKVWAKQLLRHPIVCIEATLNNMYGYIYPDRMEWLDGLGYYDIHHSEGVDFDLYKLHFIDSLSQVRYRLQTFAMHVHNTPALGMLYSCGMHTWLLLICIAGVIASKRYRLLGTLAPAALIVLVCFASPVNAYIRYMFPVMICLPLSVAATNAALRPRA